MRADDNIEAYFWSMKKKTKYAGISARPLRKMLTYLLPASSPALNVRP